MFHQILFLAIEFLIHTSLLLLCLWIMVKIQSFNYTFLGLLGSAALGSGLDMIPYIGHLLAVPVLYFCIWKVTQATMFPDAAFTVVVAYALVFAANLFIIGALMGDLRGTHRGAHGKEFAEDTNLVDLAEETNPPPVATTPPTNSIAREFIIKGVSQNAGQSEVTILVGKKNYNISLGHLVSVQTLDGPVSVRFTDLGADYVTLSIHGSQVKFPFRQN